jgi:integrase
LPNTASKGKNGGRTVPAQSDASRGTGHSGRRTFITKAAKRIVEAGGSPRDIQELAGHSSLATTQRYIHGDSRAKDNVVRMI